MPSRKRKFGDWGEKLAEEFLRKRGYDIVERNYQKKCGEIDIIARKDHAMHFLEVKTRTLGSIQRYGLPEEAIGKFKQRRIVCTALLYLAEKGYGGNIAWHIDVISIIYYSQEKKTRIKFIANAFDASGNFD